MTRFTIFALAALAGCSFMPRDEEGRLPPLPGEAVAGAGTRFDEGMERLLGPDRRFDPDIRPPFVRTGEPRYVSAPRAEDPSWWR
jgi:hypothetical protein